MRSKYCTVEANYRQEASRGLSATAELLVKFVKDHNFYKLLKFIKFELLFNGCVKFSKAAYGCIGCSECDDAVELVVAETSGLELRRSLLG